VHYSYSRLIGIAESAYCLVVANFLGLAVYMPLYPWTLSTLVLMVCIAYPGFVWGTEKEEDGEEETYLLLVCAC